MKAILLNIVVSVIIVNQEPPVIYDNIGLMYCDNAVCGLIIFSSNGFFAVRINEEKISILFGFGNVSYRVYCVNMYRNKLETKITYASKIMELSLCQKK